MRVRASIGAIAVLGVAAALFFWRADSGGSPQPDAGAVLDVLADVVEEASLAEVAQESIEASAVLEEELLIPAEADPVPIALPVIGYVVDSAGFRVEGATVSSSWVDEESRRGSAKTVSDSGGDFLFALPDESPPSEINLKAAIKGSESAFVRFPVTDAGVSDAVLTLVRHARVEGRVVNALGTGQPDWIVLANVRGGSGRKSVKAVTDATGAFDLQELLPGDCTFQLTPRGIDLNTGAPETSKSHLYYRAGGPRVMIKSPVSFTLQPGEHRRGVRLIYDAGPSISGRVTDTSGAPLPAMAVSARAEVANSRRLYGRPSTMTDEDGFYRLLSLPEDDTLTFRVAVYDPQGALIGERRENLRVNTEQNFVLAPKPTVEGRVVRADDGESIAGSRVAIWHSDIRGSDEAMAVERLNSSSSVSDKEGAFKLSAYPGNMTVGANAPGYSTDFFRIEGLNPGDSVQDIVLRLKPSGRFVEGRVVDGEGRAIANAGVYTGSPRGTPELHTSDDGSFALWLSDVETVISASKEKYSFGYADLPATTSESMEPVLITLLQGGWLAGVVRVDGIPVGRREAAVLALLPDGMMLPRLQTQTAEDGTFHIEGLTPGELSVEIVLPASDRYITMETRIEDAQESWIEVDVSTGHDAAVEGHIFVDGSPAAGVILFAWTELPGGARLGARSVSDAQGAYRIEGLAAGYIELDVRSHFSTGAQAVSALVQLRAGSSVERDFHLAP